MKTTLETLAMLKDRAQYTPDPELADLIADFEAMHHDLASSAGLWCVDHELSKEPDSFQLQHKSILQEN